MKYSKAIAMSGTVLLLAGCATPSKVVVRDPVGPCQRIAAGGGSAGWLEVFSARRRAPTDLNAEEYVWNNDFGRNEFLYTAAHTGYTVFGADGQVLKHVRNNRGMNDAQPELVGLAAGSYTIEAEAEDYGGVTFTAVVPLVVEAGEKTTVHLEPPWKPSGEGMDPSGMVRLADGRVIGCPALHALTQSIPSPAPAGTAGALAGKP